MINVSPPAHCHEQTPEAVQVLHHPTPQERRESHPGRCVRLDLSIFTNCNAAVPPTAQTFVHRLSSRRSGGFLVK